jgi:hypothetical protein
MARYRTWGLDTDRGVGWWTRAVCRGRTAMFFTRDHYVAAQAAHLCTHCPVLHDCRREAEVLTPVGAVQAGVWYSEGNTSTRGPRKRQPVDLGCGPWCAHLREKVNQ